MTFIATLFRMIVLFALAFLLVGCFATTHRGPEVLKPGQVSANIGYMSIKWTDPDVDDEVRKQLTFDGRAGILNFMDFGVIRTIDMNDYSDSATPDFEGSDAYWVDLKFQLSNLKNKDYLPQLALGYGFGDYLADDKEDIKHFSNDLYVLLGVPTPFATPYYSFRYEYFTDEIKWIPEWAWEEEADDILKAHILGVEISAFDYVRPVIEYGRFYQADISDGYNVITAGFNFYLDFKEIFSTNDKGTKK